MINEKLFALYSKLGVGLTELTKDKLEIDGPLLMYCWEEEYLKSDFKVLYIGQENNGWLGDFSIDIMECIEIYKKFELSKNGTRTTFWQYVYWINSLLNPSQKEGNNFLWTNVSKFCTYEGGCIEDGVFNKIISTFNCLSDEIDIVKPDIVLFMSGPDYDEWINLQFSKNIAFSSVYSNIPVRELARVEHPLLPRHSYRVYHPSYLQRKEKYGVIETLIDDISASK